MLATLPQHCNSYSFPSSLSFDCNLDFQPHIMSLPFNNNTQEPFGAHATSTSEENTTTIQLITSFLNEERFLNNQEYSPTQDYQLSPDMPSLDGDTPVASPVFSDLLSDPGSASDQYLSPYYSPTSNTMPTLNQVPETYEYTVPLQMSYLPCMYEHPADQTCGFCIQFQPGLFSPASTSASSSPTATSYMNPGDFSRSRRGGRISPSSSSYSSHRRSSSPSTASPSSTLSRASSGGSNSSVTRKSPTRKSGRYSGVWKYWQAPK